MNILVIGASGYIGKKLYETCRLQGHNVIGTCYKSNNVEMLLKYDIEHDSIFSIDEAFEMQKGKKCAVICAGESKISVCKEKYDRIYNINVIATKRLISQLEELGYHIIFCSSDNVYDGTKGDYKESDKINPVNAYGKMKGEVEQYIIQKYPSACIVRISKVVGITGSIQDMLEEWKAKASKQEEIWCIQDNYFNPIYIDDVVQCIMKIMRKELAGIFNLCGNNKYSRIDLCRKFLEQLGMQAYVFEKTLGEFGFNDNRPLDTSMSNKEIMKYMDGYCFTNIESCFKMYRKTIV